jgi:hypothetical protein
MKLNFAPIFNSITSEYVQNSDKWLFQFIHIIPKLPDIYRSTSEILDFLLFSAISNATNDIIVNKYKTFPVLIYSYINKSGNWENEKLLSFHNVDITIYQYGKMFYICL